MPLVTARTRLETAGGINTVKGSTRSVIGYNDSRDDIGIVAGDIFPQGIFVENFIFLHRVETTTSFVEDLGGSTKTTSYRIFIYRAFIDGAFEVSTGGEFIESATIRTHAQTTGAISDLGITSEPLPAAYADPAAFMAAMGVTLASTQSGFAWGEGGRDETMPHLYRDIYWPGSFTDGLRVRWLNVGNPLGSTYSEAEAFSKIRAVYQRNAPNLSEFLTNSPFVTGIAWPGTRYGIPYDMEFNTFVGEGVNSFITSLSAISERYFSSMRFDGGSGFPARGTSITDVPTLLAAFSVVVGYENDLQVSIDASANLYLLVTAAMLERRFATIALEFRPPALALTDVPAVIRIMIWMNATNGFPDDGTGWVAAGGGDSVENTITGLAYGEGYGTGGTFLSVEPNPPYSQMLVPRVDDVLNPPDTGRWPLVPLG